MPDPQVASGDHQGGDAGIVRRTPLPVTFLEVDDDRRTVVDDAGITPLCGGEIGRGRVKRLLPVGELHRPADRVDPDPFRRSSHRATPVVDGRYQTARLPGHGEEGVTFAVGILFLTVEGSPETAGDHQVVRTGAGQIRAPSP